MEYLKSLPSEYYLYAGIGISPSGGSKGKRSQSREFSGLILIFLAPILYGLMKDRVWTSNDN
jgi:hypothetical protein